jgi:hypothetical protein
MHGHEEANFVESPIMRIFGGKFRLPICEPKLPNQLNLVLSLQKTGGYSLLTSRSLSPPRAICRMSQRLAAHSMTRYAPLMCQGVDVL